MGDESSGLVSGVSGVDENRAVDMPIFGAMHQRETGVR